MEELQFRMFKGDSHIDMQAVGPRTNDLDAFDSHCDEAPSASDVLIAKLSAYDFEVLSERKQLALYYRHTIFKKHDALSVPDSEETLELAEASRVKMHEKQNDLFAKEKNVIIKPIDYDALNKFSKHFSAHFVP
nr:hypothetical protein [Tanacetum cinerariifolium]